jgi:DNA anti-recombination protein RmuC
MLKMLSLLAPYKWLIAAVAAIALMAGLIFGAHKFLEHERNLGYQKAVAEYTAKQLVAEQAARAKEVQLNDKIQKARDEAKIREQKINDLSSTLNDTTKRMRDTVANLRNQLSRASQDSVRRQADAALEVSGECTNRYSKLAEETSRLASEIILLQEAWPN